MSGSWDAMLRDEEARAALCAVEAVTRGVSLADCEASNDAERLLYSPGNAPDPSDCHV